MKKYLILFLLLASSLQATFGWTAYVYKDGAFCLYPDSLWRDGNLPLEGEKEYEPGTIGYIPSKLGYLQSEWYKWFSKGTDVVIFKAFTQQPICVLANIEDGGPILSGAEVQKILKGFDYKKEFDVYAAAEGKVRQSFLEDALGVKASNGYIDDVPNGLKLGMVI